MISSDTYGPHQTPNPCVVSLDPIEVDQTSEHPPPPIVEEIASLEVPSIPPDTSQKLHPNMEYDQDYFPTQALTPPLP